MSLVAHHLESAGIPTVIIGSARDIVEEFGVARFVFTDFPLGNPCGKPHDRQMQRRIVGLALTLLDRAFAPETTVKAPFRWSDDGWRERYMDSSDAERLAAKGRERRRLQEARRTRPSGGAPTD